MATAILTEVLLDWETNIWMNFWNGDMRNVMKESVTDYKVHKDAYPYVNV